MALTSAVLVFIRLGHVCDCMQGHENHYHRLVYPSGRCREQQYIFVCAVFYRTMGAIEHRIEHAGAF